MAEVEGASKHARSSRARRTRRRFSATLGWTVVGAVLPGTGYLAAGRRRLGAFVLLVLGVLLMLGLGILIAEHSMKLLIAELASRPNMLLTVGIGALVLAALWIIVILTSHRMLLPQRAPAWQQAIGGLVAIVLCAAVAVPSGVASRDSFATYDLITNVFANGNKPVPIPGSTPQHPVDRANPWAGKPRVNLLLLGADAGDDRTGLRTDTVIVASIDTTTGAAVLFSLPRNLEDVPFPVDSPLYDKWPNGFNCGYSGGCILNAIYEQGEAVADEFHMSEEDAGIAAVQGAVGETLGLSIDYHMMVDLSGFEQLVNALGGVTIDVGPTRVPIGGLDIHGNPQPASQIEEWIPSGIQHLNGFQALWFARDRWTPPASDYMRMRRQRCLLNAIVGEATPATVLANYLDIAAAAKDNITTNIPYQLFPAFVELADLVKQHPIRTLPFTNDVIVSAHPDLELIRTLVQRALVPPPATIAPLTTPPPSGTPSTSPSETAPPSETPTTNPTEAVVANDVCG